MKLKRAWFAALMVALLSSGVRVEAHGLSEPAPAVSPAQVPKVFRASAGNPPKGVVPFDFSEVYARPTGPRGLEPGARLLELAGTRVRMRGYMVNQSPAARGGFFLSPVPATVGMADEGLADDVPANAIFVRFPSEVTAQLERDSGVYLPGALQFDGTLKIERFEDEASGRIAPIQLVLDARDARRILKLKPEPLLADRHGH